MYHAFCARVEDGITRRKWNYDHWTFTTKRRTLETGKRRQRTAGKAPEHSDDYQWRKNHAELDQFLARCEVAGRILRRWALPGGQGQHLEFPATPGSLEVGHVVEWDSSMLRARAEEIATSEHVYLEAIAA